EAAIENGAKTVPGVRIATVSEDDLGVATLMVTDADGNSTLQMVADVEAGLPQWRAVGTHIEVVGGHPALVDLRLGLKTTVGFDVDAVAPILIAAVETRLKRLGVGEALYQDMVIGAIVPLYPDDILKVTFLATNVNGAPVDENVDPIPMGEAMVVRPGTITVEKVP
ncbi:MAG TPA: hypothetical protein VFA62_05400, partial [Acidimicrobiia bacterium]|nr:hypothetical protein [Acidimicrobiia bacterium]